jgi:hypothetical protein
VQAPLWQCPQCGHRFVTANLWHSCVRIAVAHHFRGKPPERKRTWDAWVAAARACGPITAYAQKSRLVIQARVRFAGAMVRVEYLDAGLWLRRRAAHPRLRRVEDLGVHGFVHRFRLEHPRDIDARLQALVREAYRVGIQDPPRPRASAARSTRPRPPGA